MAKIKKKIETSIENLSGIHPCGDKVLIRPDTIESVTEGGIVLPETVTDLHMQGQTAGTLIAVGSEAYSHYTEIEESASGKKITRRGYSKPHAVPGDRVMFAKYGGQKVWGKDGVEYRLINDEDVNAIIEEGVVFHDLNGRKKVSK